VRSLEARRLDVDRRMRGRERVDDVEDAINASDLSADEGGRWAIDNSRASLEESLCLRFGGAWSARRMVSMAVMR
jgi:hypothetical protein